MENELCSQEKITQAIGEIFDMRERLGLNILELCKAAQSVYAASQAAILANAQDVTRAVELLDGMGGQNESESATE